MDTQAWIVALIVAACAAYALWTLVLRPFVRTRRGGSACDSCSNCGGGTGSLKLNRASPSTCRPAPSAAGSAPTPPRPAASAPTALRASEDAR